MMNTLTAAVLGLSLLASAPVSAPADSPDTLETAPYALVEHFESGYAADDWTVLELTIGGETYSIDVETNRFQHQLTRDERLEYVSRFMEYTGNTATDSNGDTLYHFRELKPEGEKGIFWLVSEKELGFTPQEGDIHQFLYLENDTPGDGDEQREDDIFLMVNNEW